MPLVCKIQDLLFYPVYLLCAVQLIRGFAVVPKLNVSEGTPVPARVLPGVPVILSLPRVCLQARGGQRPVLLRAASFTPGRVP